MSAFQQALNQGYSAEDVLAYFAKAVPTSASMIKKAMKAGHPAQQILGFLNKSFDTEDRTGLSESERHGVNRRADSERAKYGLKVAGSALVLPAAGIAARSALSRSLPSQIQNMLPGVANQAVQNASPSPSQGATALAPMSPQSPQIAQSVNPSSQPPTNPVPPILPQSAQPIQPQGNGINASQIFSKYPLLKAEIDKTKAKNPPEAIAALLRKFNAKDASKLEKETGQPIEAIISEYLSQTPDLQANVKPALQPEIPEEKKPLNREEALGKFRDKLIAETGNETTPEPKSEPVKIEKGSTVSAPQGLGEIREIRNGKALVEVNGKIHKVDEDELESPLYSEDEIADAYDEMFKRIPEEHKSGFIQWSGYDEDRNVLGFIPRGGKYEELENITPEEAELIRKGKGVARTSGEEREGLWVQGEDTRGGIISQIIHDRRKKNKGEEAQQLEFGIELPKPDKQDRGMKPIFDENAYPRGLSQARDKRKRDEERARKKKEKEDEKAKKRKK